MSSKKLEPNEFGFGAKYGQNKLSIKTILDMNSRKKLGKVNNT
jgi:hypothetical protein